MTRRRSSNDGCLSPQRSILGISPGLRRSLLASLPPTPRPEKTPKKPDGRRGAPRIKEPDEVVLEVRRLWEQGGLSLTQIKIHLSALGVEIDRERIRNLCNYTTRSHLVPQAGASAYFPTQQENPCTTSTPSTG